MVTKAATTPKPIEVYGDPISKMRRPIGVQLIPRIRTLDRNGEARSDLASAQSGSALDGSATSQ